MMDAIIIKNLTKRYKDVVAVDDLSLTIKKGELFALLGVNGAGKTTTVKMLSCLSAPSVGDAILLGKSILTDSAEVKKFIAISPQETAVASGLTTLENLRLICGVYGFSRQESEAKIKEICARLELDGVLGKKAGKLSGGWQRRLSIAMALISEPKILFLDEPTLGLDVIARSQLWDVIRALKGEVTIILTTHYMEEAEELADRVGIMKDGKLLVCDTPQNVKQNTGESTFEKAFISVIKGVAQ